MANIDALDEHRNVAKIAYDLVDSAEKVYYEKYGVNDFVSGKPAQEVIEMSRNESEACRKGIENLKALYPDGEVSMAMPFDQYAEMSAAKDIAMAQMRVLSDRAEMADARGSVLKAYYGHGQDLNAAVDTYVDKYNDYVASRYAQADAEMFADAAGKTRMDEMKAAVPEIDSLYHDMFEKDLSAITLQEFYECEHKKSDGTSYSDDQIRQEAGIQFAGNKNVYTEYQQRLADSTKRTVPTPFSADSYNSIRNSMETSIDAAYAKSCREALRDMGKDGYETQKTFAQNLAGDPERCDFAEDIRKQIDMKPSQWRPPLTFEDIMNRRESKYKSVLTEDVSKTQTESVKQPETFSPVVETVVENMQKLYQISPTDAHWQDTAIKSMSSEQLACVSAKAEYVTECLDGEKDAHYHVLDNQVAMAKSRRLILEYYDSGEIGKANDYAERYVDALTKYTASRYAESFDSHINTQPDFSTAYNEFLERPISVDPDKTTEYLKSIMDASGRAMPTERDYQDYMDNINADKDTLRSLGTQKYAEQQGMEIMPLPEKNAAQASLYEQVYEMTGKNPTKQVSLTDVDYFDKLSQVYLQESMKSQFGKTGISLGSAISSGKTEADAKAADEHKFENGDVSKGHSPYDD